MNERPVPDFKITYAGDPRHLHFFWVCSNGPDRELSYKHADEPCTSCDCGYAEIVAALPRSRNA